MPRSAPIRTEILRHVGDFVRCWNAIQALRQELNVADDVLLNPLHFLAATDHSRRPCSVACWQGERLIGLLYATEHFVSGIGTGYAVGGDFVGRGLLLCSRRHEAEVVRRAVTCLTSSGIHALHLRMFLTGQAAREQRGFPRGLRLQNLDALVPGDRMELPATFDGWLATLGRHTRRNVRYYTRKAALAGVEFVPTLTCEEYETAVLRLNARSAFLAAPRRLAQDERLLGLHGGGLRFGLRAADGNLVAVVCGFSQRGRFHLLTQLNDVHLEHLSLSMVLRGYIVQHLIESGHTNLQFMGGASLIFGRFCVPQDYRSLFVDKAWGLAAAIKFVASRSAALATRLGLPAPDMLKALSNGFLDRDSLVARTALSPAAIVSEALAARAAAAAPLEHSERQPARRLSTPKPKLIQFPEPASLGKPIPPASVWARRHASGQTSRLDRTSS